VSSDTEHDYTVHPSSYVDNDVEIGPGTVIWHFTHICSGARIGARCRIGQHKVAHLLGAALTHAADIVEAALLELCGEAGTPEFKAVQKVIL